MFMDHTPTEATVDHLILGLVGLMVWVLLLPGHMVKPLPSVKFPKGDSNQDLAFQHALDSGCG